MLCKAKYELTHDMFIVHMLSQGASYYKWDSVNTTLNAAAMLSHFISWLLIGFSCLQSIQ